MVRFLNDLTGALRKLLNEAGKKHEPIESVCVVGRSLIDWDEENGRTESKRMLEAKEIRVVLYQELIENAYKAYKAFVDMKHEAGKVFELIKKLDSGEILGTD